MTVMAGPLTCFLRGLVATGCSADHWANSAGVVTLLYVAVAVVLWAMADRAGRRDAGDSRRAHAAPAISASSIS